MVTTATNFGRSGVADWIIQRFSAVILAAYTLFIVFFIISQPQLDYTIWHTLFGQLWMRIFSLLALLSIAAHGWIGLWGIVTDYLTSRMLGTKGLILRLLVLSIYAVITVAYLVWGIQILWGA
jgi:succinate dehydrogenase / fumarate reductase membrane anchor subunit